MHSMLHVLYEICTRLCWAFFVWVKQWALGGFMWFHIPHGCSPSTVIIERLRRCLHSNRERYEYKQSMHRLNNARIPFIILEMDLNWNTTKYYEATRAILQKMLLDFMGLLLNYVLSMQTLLSSLEYQYGGASIFHFSYLFPIQKHNSLKLRYLICHVCLWKEIIMRIYSRRDSNFPLGNNFELNAFFPEKKRTFNVYDDYNARER